MGASGLHYTYMLAGVAAFKMNKKRQQKLYFWKIKRMMRGFMVNSYFYQLVPSQLVLFHWSTRTFLQLVLWSTRTFSLVKSYFFLKNYLPYAMFLYYGTPWTFNMILRLLKEHKSAHISVFFTHWRVKSLLVEV